MNQPSIGFLNDYQEESWKTWFRKDVAAYVTNMSALGAAIMNKEIHIVKILLSMHGDAEKR
jgi:hypothetical protein